jgi:hypothetical protein
MARQDTKLESEGAEFLVLGQLLIEGIPAYKAYTNLRGYDLVAVAPATDANHFLIKKFDCDFVVLVRLNRGYRFSGAAKRALDQKADPESYVLSAKDALSLAKTGTWSKIVWRTEKFVGHRRRWDIIREFLGKPGRKKR